MIIIVIFSTDDDPSLQIESFWNSRFTWCFHKTKLMLLFTMQNFKELTVRVFLERKQKPIFCCRIYTKAGDIYKEASQLC